MKDILIVLLVIALLVLIVGAVNSGLRVDLDYVFGTWHDVSLFTLIAIAAAALVVVGLTVAAFAGIRAAGDRRKLERELEQTYGRLREAEARTVEMAEQAAAAAPAERQRELPVVSDPSAAAGVTDAAAGPYGDTGTSVDPEAHDVAGADDAGAGPDDAGTGPDDRTIALNDRRGRDDA